MKTSILLSSFVSSAPANEVVSCRLANEAALLHIPSGTYYSLDSVGAALWELIAQPIEVAKVHRALLERYDVTFEELEKDVLNLLDDMATANLIIVK